MGCAVAIGWAALAVAAPVFFAAMVDPEARPLVIRRLKGWQASLRTLARSLFRSGGVSGQGNANVAIIPPQPRNIEGAEAQREAPLNLMPPSAFLAIPQSNNSPVPTPSAPVLILFSFHIIFTHKITSININNNNVCYLYFFKLFLIGKNNMKCHLLINTFF